MKDWRIEYKASLEDKDIPELKRIIKEKEEYINKLDKRTYNGRVMAIFERAYIICIEELIIDKIEELYQNDN